MKRYIVMIILLMVLLANADSRDIIAPGLSEDALWEYLVDNYKTSTTLGYTDARDVLYGEIDLQPGNLLETIYSGYTITLDPYEDPSTNAYQQGVDCEHTWPQSYGADQEPQKSDMHHLYPCKSNVNSSRSNSPFGEIPDPDTDNWYRLDEVLNTIPTSNIDEYSEKDNYGDDTWEPREEVKGNIARSMFYFYTMYYDDIQNSFMDDQMDELYAWHQQDPPDDDEIERTWEIATYQQNKPNPFVLDETLIERIWYYQGAQPQITVLQPNGGEVWQIGSTYEITWNSVEYTGLIDIFLILQGQELSLAESQPDNGSWNWTIADFLEPGSSYSIRVSAASGTIEDDSDDYFTIIQPSSNEEFVIISEYVEGSSYNKAIEIFNGSESPLDLNGWSLKKQTNGSGEFGNELFLNGTIQPWDVFVICYDNNGSNDLTDEDFVNMATSSYCLAFNGNDAVALYYDGEMMDMIGVVNSSDDWGKDMTLVRNSNIFAGSTLYDSAEWTEYPQDTFSYLGSHDLENSVFYGDIDGNGEIEAYDASLILQQIVMLISFNDLQMIVADVDGSGIIDSYDASLILRYVNDIITVFPVEE